MDDSGFHDVFSLIVVTVGQEGRITPSRQLGEVGDHDSGQAPVEARNALGRALVARFGVEMDMLGSLTLAGWR